MSKITASARGRPCLLRVPDICNFNRETVVHCHLRIHGAGGIGLKPNDLIGVRGCSACHDWLDRRNNVGLHDDIRPEITLRALVQTLDALKKEGII